MIKPWTKKAHEKKLVKERKDLQVVEEKQVFVDEFVGSLRRLLKDLNAEAECVLVIDLKKNKIVYGTFPSVDNVGGIAFDVCIYNGTLVSLEGAELLSYIFKYTKPFLKRYFGGMNAYPKKGFIEIKAGNTPIRKWDFLDLEINPYGNKRLEDQFGDSNNRDQIILISTNAKTRKILRKVFEKISPYSNSKTALDAGVLGDCQDYIINRLYSISFIGDKRIYIKENPKLVNKCRIEDMLNLIDKELLNDKGYFATLRTPKNYGFSVEESNRLCNVSIDLEKAHDYISDYLAKNTRLEQICPWNGDWYYDYNLIMTAFTEYLKSLLN